MKTLLGWFALAVVILAFVGTAWSADRGVWSRGYMDVAFQYLAHPFYQTAKLDRRNKSQFGARQRTRMVLEYTHDEYLSALLQFEINQGWGFTSADNSGNYSGGRVNADGVNIATKHAYFNWFIPDSSFMVRMGIQPLSLPWSLPGDNSVLNADGAGVSISCRFNDLVAASVFWGRLWDDATFGDYSTWGDNGGDDWDAFGLIMPLTFDGATLKPYAVYSRMGRNVRERVPNGYPIDGGSRGGDYNGWWGGLSAGLKVFDPLFVNMDTLYGSLSNNSAHGSNHGWFSGLEIGWQLDFMTPSLVAFYSSGKRRASHDSRIPVLMGSYGANGPFAPTTLGTGGDFNLGYDTAFTNGMNGLWGIGLKLMDITFMEKLYHTVNFFFYSGTSAKDQADAKRWRAVSGIMTSKDRAWEVNFENRYNIYENLITVLELSWLKPDFDHNIGGRDSAYMSKGLVKVAMQVQYNF